MSVYVDQLTPCVTSPQWRWPKSCHLVADTVEELHGFAGRIGLRRSWFQLSRCGMPHYDLTPARRQRAVEQGAIEITRRQLGEIMSQHRRARRL
jgi:hypothetical protein